MVHIQDIFIPHDYLLDWLKGKNFWNELYFLYLFIQLNTKFKIQFCNSYFVYNFRDKLKDIQKNFYEFSKGIVNEVFGGSSICLKVQ